MRMHAAAGEPAIGFGHEGRIHAMPARGTLDDALHHHRPIRRAHDVIGMGEVQLVLVRPIFPHNAIERNILFGGIARDIGEDAVIGMQLLDAQHVLLPALPAFRIGAIGARLGPGEFLGLDEVEFEFGRDHGGQLRRCEAGQHILQHRAGIGEIGAAIGIHHAQHDLRCPAGEPGDGQNGTFHRLAEAIGITCAPGEACFIGVPPPDILGEDRARHQHPLVAHIRKLFGRHPFPARHAVPVHQEGFHNGATFGLLRLSTHSDAGKHCHNCLRFCFPITAQCDHIWQAPLPATGMVLLRKRRLCLTKHPSCRSRPGLLGRRSTNGCSGASGAPSCQAPFRRARR
jgi:hypothetical protein